MGRSRQIKMERGDTLGGTTPLILMGKPLGTPFVTGEYRRRRRKDRGLGRTFWQLLLVFLVLMAVAAVLGLGYERFAALMEGSIEPVTSIESTQPIQGEPPTH